MGKLYSVAIDGPGGAGKSTLARRMAERFGFIYVDTGAIYRTVGLAAQRAGLEAGDEEGVSRLLGELEISLSYNAEGEQRMFLNGEDVTGLLRTPQSSFYASKVSAMPEVRAFLLQTQRDLAEKHSVVMDGRDIGTVVLPGAGLKIFLSASPEERARRRFEQLRQQGEACTLEEVLEDIQARDEQDTNRSAAPLKAAEDAVLLDNSGQTPEESLAFLEKLARERFGL